MSMDPPDNLEQPEPPAEQGGDQAAGEQRSANPLPGAGHDDAAGAVAGSAAPSADLLRRFNALRQSRLDDDIDEAAYQRGLERLRQQYGDEQLARVSWAAGEAEAGNAVTVRLTPQEHATLRLLAQGLDDAQIAARLGVKLTTALRYIRRVIQELGVADRAGAAAKARELGLADAPAGQHASAVPFPESEVARQRFSEIEPIGRGSVTRAYRATDRLLKRRVAVKEIDPSLSPQEREAVIRRFQSEAPMLAQLDNPYVVRVYDYDAASHYLYQEYIAEGSVYNLLTREQRLDEPTALLIARDMVRAIAAHWARKIVHRDIKPSNVLLVRDAQGQIAGAKLSDYGDAQDLDVEPGPRDTPHPGTPGYKSPEQERSLEALSAASDLYNVGLVLWEMLAGEQRHPHQNEPINAAGFQASEATTAIVTRALEPELARRYADPAEMLADIERARRALASGSAQSSAQTPQPDSLRIPQGEPSNIVANAGEQPAQQAHGVAGSGANDDSRDATSGAAEQEQISYPAIFLNIKLRVEAAEDQLYQVEILMSPAGESRDLLSFNLAELQQQAGRLESAGKPQDLGAELGLSMFHQLFYPESSARSILQISRHEARQREAGLRLLLDIRAPELAALPWELLHDGQSFLALERDISIVRYYEDPRIHYSLQPKDPARMLFLSASPANFARLNLQRARETVAEGIRPLSDQGRLELEILEHTTVRLLSERFVSGVDILHFDGLGGMDQRRGEAVLLLEDDSGAGHDLPTSSLAYMANVAGPQLVVLNTDNIAQGLEQLGQSGVPLAIGMQSAVTEVVADAFNRGFYAGLAQGLPVDIAVTLGRREIHRLAPQRNDGSEQVDWFAPQIYSRVAEIGPLFPYRAPGSDAPLERQLLAALYQRAGGAYQADSFIQQVARQDKLGAPLKLNVDLVAQGRRYLGQVYALDALFSAEDQPNAISHLSKIVDPELHQALERAVYAVLRLPTDSGSPFYAYAKGQRLGMPLSTSQEVVAEGQRYAAQLFAFDLLYTPLASPEEQTDWSDIRRFSVLVESTSGDEQRELQQELLRLAFSYLGGDSYEPGARFWGAGVLHRLGMPLSNSWQAALDGQSYTLALFAGGLLYTTDPDSAPIQLLPLADPLPLEPASQSAQGDEAIEEGEAEPGAEDEQEDAEGEQEGQGRKQPGGAGRKIKGGGRGAEQPEPQVDPRVANVYALVIGVGQQSDPSIAPRLSAERDARAITSVLGDTTLCGLPPENIRLLLGEYATRTSILEAIDQLGRQVSQEATLLVYFAGLGAREQVWLYLLPYDATYDLGASALRDADLYNRLGAIPGRQIIIMLECSYAGAFAPGTRQIVLAACSKDQMAYDDDQGNGLFTSLLIEGLVREVASDDGLIYPQDLVEYILSMRRTSVRALHTQQHEQSPQLTGRLVDNAPIALYRGGSARNALSLAAAHERMDGAARNALLSAETIRRFKSDSSLELEHLLAAMAGDAGWAILQRAMNEIAQAARDARPAEREGEPLHQRLLRTLSGLPTLPPANRSVLGSAPASGPLRKLLMTASIMAEGRGEQIEQRHLLAALIERLEPEGEQLFPPSFKVDLAHLKNLLLDPSTEQDENAWQAIFAGREPEAAQALGAEETAEQASRQETREQALGRITILQGDLLEQQADALANMVSLSPDIPLGQLGQAYLQRVGEELQAALQTKGSMQHGEVLVTSAGPLAARYVLNLALSGELDEQASERRVAGLLALLEQAEALEGVSTLAIPSFAASQPGLTPSELAQPLLEALLEHLRHGSKLEQVTIVCQRTAHYQAYQTAHQALTGGAAEQEGEPDLGELAGIVRPLRVWLQEGEEVPSHVDQPAFFAELRAALRPLRLVTLASSLQEADCSLTIDHDGEIIATDLARQSRFGPEVILPRPDAATRVAATLLGFARFSALYELHNDGSTQRLGTGVQLRQSVESPNTRPQRILQLTIVDGPDSSSEADKESTLYHHDNRFRLVVENRLSIPIHVCILTLSPDYQIASLVQGVLQRRPIPEGLLGDIAELDIRIGEYEIFSKRLIKVILTSEPFGQSALIQRALETFEDEEVNDNHELEEQILSDLENLITNPWEALSAEYALAADWIERLTPAAREALALAERLARQSSMEIGALELLWGLYHSSSSLLRQLYDLSSDGDDRLMNDLDRFLGIESPRSPAELSAVEPIPPYETRLNARAMAIMQAAASYGESERAQIDERAILRACYQEPSGLVRSWLEHLVALTPWVFEQQEETTASAEQARARTQRLTNSGALLTREQALGRIQVVRGNLLEFDADVIVDGVGLNPRQRGGLGLQLHRHIGEEAREALQTIDLLKPAQVIVHALESLPAALAFYVATRDERNVQTVESTVAGVASALERVETLDVKSMAFPSLGTGAAGLSVEALAPAILKAAVEHLRYGSRLERVSFVCLTEYDYQGYLRAYAALGGVVSAALAPRYALALEAPAQAAAGELVELRARLVETNGLDVQSSFSLTPGVSELTCLLTPADQGLKLRSAEAVAITLAEGVEPAPAGFTLQAHLQGERRYAVELVLDGTQGGRRRVRYEGQLLVQAPLATEALAQASLAPLEVRVVVKPPFMLQVHSSLPAGEDGPRDLHYRLTSRLPGLLLRGEPAGQVRLPAGELDRLRALLEQALEEATALQPEESRRRMLSYGAYLFDRLFPYEGAAAFREAFWAVAEQITTWLIVEDGVTWLPWELVAPYEQGQPPRFLCERYQLSRWVEGLGPALYSEIPLGEVALASYGEAEPERERGTLERWGRLVGDQQLTSILPMARVQSPFFGLHLLRRLDQAGALEIAPRDGAGSRTPDDDLRDELAQARLDLRMKRPVVGLSLLGQPQAGLADGWPLPERALPFLRAGASALLGAWWPTSEEADRVFWTSFYDLLAIQRLSLGEAAWRARLATRRALPGRPDWLAYTVFGNPRARPYEPELSAGYSTLECLNPDEPFLPDKSYEFRASIRVRPPLWHENRLVRVGELPDDMSVLFLAPGLQDGVPRPVALLRDERQLMAYASLTLKAERPGAYPLIAQFFQGKELIEMLQLVINVGKQAGDGHGH